MEKILETDRLYLRELTLNDKMELSGILSDKEAMKYYDHPFSDAEVERWIEWNIENYKKYNHGLWAVVLKENDIFLGDCGITMQEIENRSLPEIGYHIKKECWNQGFATEAAIACKNYAFDKLQKSELYTYTTTDNIPSRRVAEKNGMKYLKAFKKVVYGREVEEVLYGIKWADFV